MLRSLPRAQGPYRVVFTPKAWKAIGQMPTAMFDVFEQAVEDLADKCGRLNASTPGVQRPLRLTVGTVEIHYERDDATRVITLVGITQAASEP
jgi:mRNA-degrading endonuclease RelE of RelBE toxin-antitoxin system